MPKYGTAALSTEKKGTEPKALITGYICKYITVQDIRRVTMIKKETLKLIKASIALAHGRDNAMKIHCLISPTRYKSILV
jgi:hypothetical protein